MKKYLAVIAVSVFVLVGFVGCETSYNAGIEKDLMSGLEVTNYGLSYDDVYVRYDDERTNESVFEYDTEVFIDFAGVDGFEQIDGNVYPGAMIVVADKDGKEIKEFDDLFAQYSETGVEAELAGDMFVSLLIDEELKTGETYVWYSKIWDKKGDGKIETTFDIGGK